MFCWRGVVLGNNKGGARVGAAVCQAMRTSPSFMTNSMSPASISHSLWSS